ncbi:extensin-like [Sorghum bicolor]|nr:extensin-like [Sorghum bicolor]|eukprot:XP_021309261.1 extensin-like [Sorghum bicolor]
MRSIRRELQRRRPKPLAPTRSVAKKPSASPPPRHGSSDAIRGPCPRPPHREVPSSTNGHSRGSTVTDASPEPRPRSSSRCTPASAGSAFRATPAAPAQLKPGTVVRVRTRTATLKTGQVLVLCLKATIVSPSTDGGYEVVYDANLPRGDPKSTVHVAPDQVRAIDPSPSPTTPPPSLPPPTATVAATTKKDMPRPTTAGKSLRLIRSLFPEMELPVCA